MKTADLIPLILLELNECDKYGFELTKSIETKSKGKIIIKQPTLYTILKKLEKSKFISSYWQDSDIGGKRHYYKITDNGKMQVATLPDYEKLIENIIDADTDNQLSFSSDYDEGVDTSFNTSSITSSENLKTNNDNYRSVSIMDSIIPDSQSEEENSIQSEKVHELTESKKLDLQENILPSHEVFENNSIDNTTELEINQSNTEILKSDKINTEEKFAENKDVSKFTEKQSTIITDEYKMQFNNIESNTNSKQTESDDLDLSLNIDENNTYVNDEPYKKIKYVDYIDFKTNPNYIYSKKTAKGIKNRVLSTSLYLLVMMIICSIVVNFQTNVSALYYVFFLIALGVLIFYPSIYACFYERFRLYLQNNKYEPDLKKQLYISLAIELFIIVVCIIVNINIGNNSIQKMFSITNFANFYAPIILSTVIFADILFAYIFMKKNKK